MLPVHEPRSKDRHQWLIRYSNALSLIVNNKTVPITIFCGLSFLFLFFPKWRNKRNKRNKPISTNNHSRYASVTL